MDIDIKNTTVPRAATMIVTDITVAHAATVINAIIIFLRYSLGLAIITLLLYSLSPSNSANSWTVAAKHVHTSLWPFILRGTSESHASTHINFFSKLSLISALLLSVCSIVTPLGLIPGPPFLHNYHNVTASFIEDNSPLGKATSPPQYFKHSRLCGGFTSAICPGNTPDTTEIPPSVFEAFRSTPHGPFNMQPRRYFINKTEGVPPQTIPQVHTLQSVVLRDGIFAAKGVVIDLSNSPGVGLLNHTIPSLEEGATWSHDILWLEPETTCVNTNLTADYVMTNMFGVEEFNLTDRGGFVNIPAEYPTMSSDGQNINLYEHAYTAAILSNVYAMQGVNTTTNDSNIGKGYVLDSNGFEAGFMHAMGVKYISSPHHTTPNRTIDTSSQYKFMTFDSPDVTFDSSHTWCRGFGGTDNANISNVSVHCGVFAGPTQRIDGKDDRIISSGSKWSQTFYACASATRASIQTVTFSVNSSKELSDLQITRAPSNASVLWAVEKTDMKIQDVDLFWGRVAETYKLDSSLSTIPKKFLYVPAGAADVWGFTNCGQPSTVPAIAWSTVYRGTTDPKDLDYSGKTNYALLNKWQSLLTENKQTPERGHAQIRNLIWTDIVANSLVGMDTHFIVNASSFGHSVTYDFKYGIPFMMLFIIWVPSFVMSVCVLLLGLLKISHIRKFVDHTAVGRLALGHSALGAASDTPTGMFLLGLRFTNFVGVFLITFLWIDYEAIHLNEEDWRKTVGRTTISLHPTLNGQERGEEILYDELPKSEYVA